MRGVEIIQHIDALKPSIPIVLHHHERYDGKGYPDKLKGRKIPLGARIMAVCDAYEAMMTKKPYRAAMSMRNSLEEISKHAGTQFDPEVVDIFLKLTQQGFLNEISNNFQERDEEK